MAWGLEWEEREEGGVTMFRLERMGTNNVGMEFLAGGRIGHGARDMHALGRTRCQIYCRI